MTILSRSLFLILGLVSTVSMLSCASTSQEAGVAKPLSETLGPGPSAAPGAAGIDLPTGSALSLPRKPGVATHDALIHGIAYVSAIERGTFGVGTVVAVRSERGDFDLDYAVSTLSISEPLVGDPGEIQIVSAESKFALELGQRYLIVASPGPAGHSIAGGGLLFDRVDGAWQIRDPDPADPLIITDPEIPGLVEAGIELLASRQAAGRAKIELTHQRGDTYQISGYIPGESMELTVCAFLAEDFNPRDNLAWCDSTFSQQMTPDGTSFEIEYRAPRRIVIGTGEEIDCSITRCGLVVFDLGWPDRVFAFATA